MIWDIQKLKTNFKLFMLQATLIIAALVTSAVISAQKYKKILHDEIILNINVQELDKKLKLLRDNRAKYLQNQEIANYLSFHLKANQVNKDELDLVISHIKEIYKIQGTQHLTYVNPTKQLDYYDIDFDLYASTDEEIFKFIDTISNTFQNKIRFDSFTLDKLSEEYDTTINSRMVNAKITIRLYNIFGDNSK